MKRLLVLAAVVLVGCGSAKTEVDVRVDAESGIRGMAGAVHLVVRGGAGDATTYDSPAALDVNVDVGNGASRSFPLEITVAPRQGDASRRWSFEATALENGTNAVIATARVRGRFVEGRALHIELVFEDACLNVACGADQTCRSGTCVDSTYGGTVGDAGVDSGSQSADGGIPAYCPGADVYVPDPDAGSLDGGGVPYPQPAPCPVVHTANEACTGTARADDICFTERKQLGFAYCRVTCGMTNPDGGVDILDEAKCQAIHADSHCMQSLGIGSERDQPLCTLPCNAIDDVGCLDGLHCHVVQDSDIERLGTQCTALQTNPRHQYEPCEVEVGGTTTLASANGCAAGYLCGYDQICVAGGDMGYVCLQICDFSNTLPALACPSGSTCRRLGSYQDVIGGLPMGVCRSN